MTQDNGGQETIDQMLGEVSDYEISLLDRWAGKLAAAELSGRWAHPESSIPDDDDLARRAYERAVALLLEKRRREEAQ